MDDNYVSQLKMDDLKNSILQISSKHFYSEVENGYQNPNIYFYKPLIMLNKSIEKFTNNVQFNLQSVEFDFQRRISQNTISSAELSLADVSVTDIDKRKLTCLKAAKILGLNTSKGETMKLSENVVEGTLKIKRSNIYSKWKFRYCHMIDNIIYQQTKNTNEHLKFVVEKGTEFKLQDNGLLELYNRQPISIGPASEGLSILFKDNNELGVWLMAIKNAILVEKFKIKALPSTPKRYQCFNKNKVFEIDTPTVMINEPLL